MRRLAPLLLALALAAHSAAAQGTPTRRPPRDTIRIAEPATPLAEAEADSAADDAPEDAAAADGVPPSGPFSRDGGRGPFSVESSGQVAPRPPRGEVVWLRSAPASRAASADTAASRRAPARDTARTGRTASTGTPARDTASTRRAGNTGSPPSRTGTSATAPANRAGQGSAGARTHTVAPGETFFGIARRYGVTAAQLRALNPDVNWESVEIGDVLRLPATARDSRAGQGTSAQGPRRTGSQATGGTGSQPSRTATRTHTVQPGETLFGIARRYGVTRQAILDANGLETDQVRTGQRLTIPPSN